MQPLVLYPLKSNLQKGLAVGLVSVALAAYLWMLQGGVEFSLFALIAAAFGGYLSLSCARHLLDPRPVFEADAQGFSVKGGGRRPWEQFRGVEVYQVKSGMFTVARTVRIKLGKTMLGGAKDIKWQEQSEPATDMVVRIHRYAEAAQAGASVADKYHVPPARGFEAGPAPVDPAPLARPGGAMGAARVAPDPVQVGFAEEAPRPSFAERMQIADTGSPVTSVPRLGDRLFGRKKVL